MIQSTQSARNHLLFCQSLRYARVCNYASHKFRKKHKETLANRLFRSPQISQHRTSDLKLNALPSCAHNHSTQPPSVIAKILKECPIHAAGTVKCLAPRSYSPNRELAKPYHTHPLSPMSQRPCVLAAKLNGVPSTHTSRSLTEMFTRSRLMGERSIL